MKDGGLVQGLGLCPRLASTRRRGFTLLELILALALVVVATSLIGSLMTMYARSFTTRAEDVRRKQLARSLLSMIADDIRAAVVQQPYDKSVFGQLFGTDQMDLDSMNLDGEAGASLGLGSDPSNEAGGTGANSADPTNDPNSDLSSSLNSTLPAGIFGNQNQLMVDVSRVPRIDEFLAVQMNMGQTPLGTLVDIPGDVKRVTYYVQAPSVLGVQDSMSRVNSGMITSATSPTMVGGLVRRQLDRRVTSFAEESGLANQLMATGDLVAPEVVSLEFSYFDGTQWTYQWDSSQLGLPWLINITLAVQSATGEEKSGIASGQVASTMDPQQRQLSGIEIYELTVAIPGAQMQARPSPTGQSTGMGGLGL